MFHRRASVKEASMSEIDQALGVLAERFGVGIDTAEALLQDVARLEQTPLPELAECVVASTTDDCAVLPRSLSAGLSAA
jgi:ANTAR domain-containing protein